MSEFQDCHDARRKVFINLVNEQKAKQDADDHYWEHSPWKVSCALRNNNTGVVAEQYFNYFLGLFDIPGEIDGSKTKKKGGGSADGWGGTRKRSIELKGSYLQGIHTGKNVFQHDMSQKPWLADLVVFIDITPHNIYMTMYENFTEDEYKSENQCLRVFQNKKITWREGEGKFKIDTSLPMVKQMAGLVRPVCDNAAELKNKPYRELQKLAKHNHMKANGKKEDIVERLTSSVEVPKEFCGHTLCLASDGTKDADAPASDSEVKEFLYRHLM